MGLLIEHLHSNSDCSCQGFSAHSVGLTVLQGCQHYLSISHLVHTQVHRAQLKRLTPFTERAAAAATPSLTAALRGPLPRLCEFCSAPLESPCTMRAWPATRGRAPRRPGSTPAGGAPQLLLAEAAERLVLSSQGPTSEKACSWSSSSPKNPMAAAPLGTWSTGRSAAVRLSLMSRTSCIRSNSTCRHDA